MPVFIAYYIATTDSKEDEFTRESVQNAMELAGSYLDGSEFSISESDEPDSIMTPNYDLNDKISKMENLLSIHPMIEEKEAELKADENEEIRELMQLTALERLEKYEDVIRSINASKNCVYNIVRNFGDVLLDEIEAEIESLIPSAQDYI